jgi:hypothetical protein
VSPAARIARSPSAPPAPSRSPLNGARLAAAWPTLRPEAPTGASGLGASREGRAGPGSWREVAEVNWPARALDTPLGRQGPAACRALAGGTPTPQSRGGTGLAAYLSTAGYCAPLELHAPASPGRMTSIASTRPVRLTRKSGDPAGVAVGADSADGGHGVVRGTWSLGTCRGRSSLGCALTQQGVTAQGTNGYSSALEGARGYSRVLGDARRYSRVLAVLDVPRRPSSEPPPGFSPHVCATPACRHSS